MSLSAGEEVSGFYIGHNLNVFYNTQDLDNDDIKGRNRPVIGYAKAGNNNSNKFTRDFIRSNEGQIT